MIKLEGIRPYNMSINKLDKTIISNWSCPLSMAYHLTNNEISETDSEYIVAAQVIFRA